MIPLFLSLCLSASNLPPHSPHPLLLPCEDTAKDGKWTKEQEEGCDIR